MACYCRFNLKHPVEYTQQSCSGSLDIIIIRITFNLGYNIGKYYTITNSEMWEMFEKWFSKKVLVGLGLRQYKCATPSAKDWNAWCDAYNTGHMT